MRRAISLIFIFSCAVSAFAAEETKREFQKTVPLPAGRSFQLDHSFGSVSIHTQPGREASIHASIQCSADTKTEAEQVCSQIQIAVDDSATAVKVRTDFGSTKPGRRNQGFQVNYEIALPESTPVDVQNRFGDVSITDIQGAIRVVNTNGGVRLVGGSGLRDIENAFGPVTVRSAKGDVRVKANNGQVTITDATGAVLVGNRFGGVTVAGAASQITVNSANGSVDVRNVGGDASITNSFGQVTLAGMKGDVTVKNQNGSVSLSDIAGDATATTTFGSIAMENVKGDASATATNSSIRLTTVEGSINAKTNFNEIVVTNAAGSVDLANQNGSITVESNSSRCQPISANTSFGPIRATLRDGAGYTLDAKTTFGRISTTFTGITQAHVSERNGQIQAVAGKIPGSGACELRLSNQNGNIDILKGR